EVFGVDATFFASQDDTRLVAELREVTLDRDLDRSARQTRTTGATRQPGTLARAGGVVAHEHA
ncbi:hypothetical protein FML86_11470, partial [Mycobacterium tuberculosis]